MSERTGYVRMILDSGKVEDVEASSFGDAASKIHEMDCPILRFDWIDAKQFNTVE